MPPRPAPTHFLSLSLVTATSRPQLASSLAAFRDDVASSGFDVPAGAVRPVGTLHLTLGIMSFPRDEGLARAVALLRALRAGDVLAAAWVWGMGGLGPGGGAGGAGAGAGAGAEVGTRAKEEEEEEEEEEEQQQQQQQQTAAPDAAEERAIKGDPGVFVTLRGLRSMEHTLSKASVLYAPPTDRDGVLQAFCARIRQSFDEVLVRDDRPLLLHATIVNTIYVKNRDRDSGGGRGKGKGRGRHEKLTIDARGLLDRYEDQVWMEDVRLEKLAICRMGAKKIVVDGLEDEAYEVVAEVDL